MPLPLVEPSEREAIRKIRTKVQGLPEVDECLDVRLAHTRKKPYLYVHVLLRGDLGYEKTHMICSKIENEVRSVIANSRIAIRSEPHEGGGREVWSLVKEIVEEEPGSRGAHNIHVLNLGGKNLGVDFHLEVSAGMTPKQASEVSAHIEKKIRGADPRITQVVIHEQSVSELVASERSGNGTEVRWYVDHVIKKFGQDLRMVRAPTIRWIGNQIHVSVKVAFVHDATKGRAHEITSKLSSAIRDGYPIISRVDIAHDSIE